MENGISEADREEQGVQEEAKLRVEYKVEVFKSSTNNKADVIADLESIVARLRNRHLLVF